LKQADSYVSGQMVGIDNWTNKQYCRDEAASRQQKAVVLNRVIVFQIPWPDNGFPFQFG
jgi:hypothetical protein